MPLDKSQNKMCARELNSGAIKFEKAFLSSVVIPIVYALLSACAGTRPGSSSTFVLPSGLANGQTSLSSSAEEFNRNLPVLAARDSIAVPSDYAIGPQDLLEISLFNIGQADGIPNKVQVRVSNDGNINLPLLGQVQAGGLTRTQLEAGLRSRYEKFMHEPDVGVALAENRSNSVYVLGAVKTPGVLPVSGQETLRRVLAAVGGLTRDAGMSIQVFRQVADQEQAYVLSLDELANDKTGKVNLLVRPGDFINVPVAGSFYIDGYVEKPNVYPLARQYTLSQAVAVAGGIADFGKMSEITIFRRGPNEQVTVLNCNLNKIRSGEEEDVRIAENDVVLVPPSTGKMIVSTVLGMVGYSIGTGSGSWNLGRIRERALAMP